MKTIHRLLFVVAAATALTACGPQATPPAPTTAPSTAADATANTAATTASLALSTPLPQEISISDASALRDGGAFILDVREPSEWNEFHIPGATLIPLGELTGRVAEVPRDKPVVVVCRSGNRSKTGRDILETAGFTNVTSMAGGVTTWRNQGLPTVTGP